MSTNSPQWHLANDRYLEKALAWLRLRLVRHAQQRQAPSSSLESVTDEELAQAESTLAEARGAEPAPALISLGRRLGLSPFELQVLLLCAAMELDTRIGYLCAHAQDDLQRPCPTFALAFGLFDKPAWDVLSPERPLRYWRLVEISQPEAQPLTASPLRVDERILNYAKGLSYLDDRLTSLLSPLDDPGSGAELPPSQQMVLESITFQLRDHLSLQRPPIIQLLGPDSASKQLIAWHCAERLGLSLHRLPAELLPTRSTELETVARLWSRESLLRPVALYLDAHNIDAEALAGGPASALERYLTRCEGVVFLDVRDVWPGMGRAALTVDVTKPTQAEQQAAWNALVGSTCPAAPALLAGQFSLGIPTIRDTAKQVLADPPADDIELSNALWTRCLARTRPALDVLAQHLIPKATWNDIVLPDNEMNLLRQIADQVRQRTMVYEDWGFRHKMNRGFGITALFTGESGTGKTMAAEVIANSLRLNLYRIDLSGVVSKYVGETEKNLRRLFDAAEEGGAILFFDEADALFGKRSQVTDSHDRYANIEINYLLQRIEAYEGLAILATNRRSDLDEAFTRRLRFIVNFPVPERRDRERIWRHIFPAATPKAELDYDRLARFNMAGGSIHNAALNSAFLAAQAGTPVTMPLVLRAVRTEFLKIDRLIKEADFRWTEGSQSPRQERQDG